MNSKNTELFFGEGEDVAVVTLTDEDGQEMEAQILAAFEIEELDQEYLMAVVLTGDEDGEELNGEIHALRYQEDENGEPEIMPIEDEEEMEMAAMAMQEILESDDFEGISFSMEEEDDEVADDNYLDDIGTIFPGISIEKN